MARVSRLSISYDYVLLKSMLNDNLNLLHQGEFANILKKSHRIARMYPAENIMHWL